MSKEFGLCFRISENSGICWAVVSFQGLTGEGFTSELKCFQCGHWQTLDLSGHDLEASVSYRLSAGGYPQFLVTWASAEPARDRVSLQDGSHHPT